MVAIRICHWQRHLRFVSFTLGRNCFFHACNSVTYIRKVSRIKEWWMRMSDPELPLIDFLEFSMFAQSLSVTERPLSDLQHCAWNSAKMSHMNFHGKVIFILFCQYFTFWDFFCEVSDHLQLPFLSQFKRGEGLSRHKRLQLVIERNRFLAPKN